MKALKKIVSVLGAAVMLASVLPASVYAEEEYTDPDIYITGKVLEYDERHDYDVSSFYYLERSSELETLGQLSLTGSMNGNASKENIPAVEVTDSGELTLTYTFCNALYNDDRFNWHIVSDSIGEVDGKKLGGSVGTGALVIETSYDRENWTVADKYLDILKIPEGSFDSRSYTVNSVQLTEGSYFRVIIAYKLEQQLDDTRFWFIDTSDKDCKRVAEVYEFYASYEPQGGDGPVTSEGGKLPIGEAFSAGSKNGYYPVSDISYRDPHHGWKIGTFSLSGQTEVRGEDMLIKDPGDKIALWFSLSQADLNRLHGDSDLSIVSDSNGSDGYFGLNGADFRRGALIIRRTDKDGLAEQPQIIADFLGSIETPLTDTFVQFFDEGDYEAALVYRINEDGFFFDDQYDYRIQFKFRVRNSGCSISLLDTATDERLNEALSTENGFKLCDPSSEYMELKVSLSQWTEKENGYTETHIYDRAPEKDELFTEEGIYTVTAVNPTFDSENGEPYIKYIKKIYVGEDEVLRAYVSGENEDMTVNMIADMLKEGGTVDENGKVIPPPREESSSEAEKPERICPIAAAESIAGSAAPEGTAYESPSPSFPFIPLLCAAATAGAAVFFLYVGRQRDDDDE